VALESGNGTNLGPSLHNILQLSCDNASITIDFVRHASLAKSSDYLRKSK